MAWKDPWGRPLGSSVSGGSQPNSNCAFCWSKGLVCTWIQVLWNIVYQRYQTVNKVHLRSKKTIENNKIHFLDFLKYVLGSTQVSRETGCANQRDPFHRTVPLLTSVRGDTSVHWPVAGNSSVAATSAPASAAGSALLGHTGLLHTDSLEKSFHIFATRIVLLFLNNRIIFYLTIQ